MKTNSTKTATTTNAPGRPSLYGGNETGQPSTANAGILEALEPRTYSYRGLISGQAVLLGVAVLLAVALYMFGRTTDVRGAFSQAGEDRAVAGPTIVRKKEMPPPAAAPASAAGESSVAAIIAEVSQAAAGPVTDDPLAGLDAAAGEVIVANVESKESAPAVKGNTAMPVKKRESKPTPHASATLAKRATPAGAGKDKDVDLMAALLAYVSPGGAPGKEVKQKAAEAAGKQDKRAGANHDIVVRSAGEPTDVLVKRCRELGFIEGELCRLRICSGLWGKDPACPGSQSAGN